MPEESARFDSLALNARVCLSADEVRDIKQNAHDRYYSNRDAAVKDAARGDRRGTYYDILGSAGELAFCRLACANFDSSISPRSASRGEDKGDVIYRGRTIQVKTTEYATGRLVAPPWASRDRVSEIYCLMVLVDKTPTFEFKGFAPKGRLIQKSNLKDLGHGPTYLLEQSDLVGPDEIEWKS